MSVGVLSSIGNHTKMKLDLSLLIAILHSTFNMKDNFTFSRKPHPPHSPSREGLPPCSHCFLNNFFPRPPGIDELKSRRENLTIDEEKKVGSKKTISKKRKKTKMGSARNQKSIIQLLLKINKDAKICHPSLGDSLAPPG